MSLPPPVDMGDPDGLRATLRAILAPTPGRLHNTLLLVGQILVVVAVWEVFRIPETAIACYVVVFVSREEGAASVRTALLIVPAVLAAVLMAIVCFALSLSEPPLRVALMAGLTFSCMLASRLSAAGPLAFGFGFIVVYGLTLGDTYQGLSLQQATITNTEGSGLPNIAFMTAEESLTHALLWLMLVVGFPCMLVVVANLVAGRDPATILRIALVERLDVCAAFCRGEPGAAACLERLARHGTGPLLALAASAGRRHGHDTDAAARAPFADAVMGISLALLAWRACEPDGQRSAWLHPVGERCAVLAARARGDAPRTADATPARAAGTGPAPEGALPPLGRELCRTLDAADAAVGPSPAQGAPVAKAEAGGPDATRDAIRFALKVTLAVMTCYVLENLLDWPQIGTCVVTCFFVALGTVEESVHKMTLRLGGALVGGALGIGSILLLMPLMTELGDLLVLVAVVTFAGAWISAGSPRIAYAGWQLTFAFLLSVLQGFGPTLDMQTARDRVIGIMLGVVVTFAVFSLVWPARVADVVRGALSDALEALAAMLAHPGCGEDAGAPRRRFSAAMAKAGPLLTGEAIGSAARAAAGSTGSGSTPGRIDRTMLEQVQTLLVPVAAMAGDADPGPDLPPDVRRRMQEHEAALAGWLGDAAAWVRTGKALAALPPPPCLARGVGSPVPPGLTDRLRDREVLYGFLSREAHLLRHRAVGAGSMDDEAKPVTA